MAEFPVFSVPEVRVIAVDTSSSSSDNLDAVVQSVNFSDTMQEALVRGATYLDQYPVHSCRYDRDDTFQISVVGFSQTMLEKVNGSTGVNSGGITTHTLDHVTPPSVFKMVLVYHNDVNDKTITVTIPACFCDEFPVQSPRDGYSTQTFNVKYRPRTTADVITMAFVN